MLSTPKEVIAEALRACGPDPHMIWDDEADEVLDALAAAGHEIVHVPEGQRLSLRWDRNAQIALLNAAEQAERDARSL
jgi:hypothetical protein